VLATGFSCRCQAGPIDGVDLLHPVHALLARVKAGPGPHRLCITNSI